MAGTKTGKGTYRSSNGKSGTKTNNGTGRNQNGDSMTNTGNGVGRGSNPDLDNSIDLPFVDIDEEDDG